MKPHKVSPLVFFFLLVSAAFYLLNAGVQLYTRSMAARAEERPLPGMMSCPGIATSGGKAPEPALPPGTAVPQQEEPLPDTPWSREFEARWRDLGRRTKAERTWLEKKKVYLLSDGDIEPEYINLMRDQLLEGLQKIGATDFKVEINESPLPPELRSCFKEHILDIYCFKRGVIDLRRVSSKYSGAILMIQTTAAIEDETARGRTPFNIQGVRTSPPVRTVPPGGMADYGQGFALVSHFFNKYVGFVSVPYMNDPKQQDRFKQLLFDHYRENSTNAVHEFYHILGMPHHPDLTNPGFREANNCVMECGSVTGKPRLCDKCLVALRGLVAGIEE